LELSKYRKVVKPKINLTEQASISEIVQEIMRLFEQFFDVQVEENRQMDSNESGGEPENLGSDIAAHRGLLLKKLAVLNKANLD